MGCRNESGNDKFGMGWERMNVKNIHRGTSLESWLEEEGFLENATIYAIKSVIAWQLGEEMKNKKISKKHMTEMMQVSDDQLNNVLDPRSKNTHLGTLQSAAKILGRKLKIELV